MTSILTTRLRVIKAHAEILRDAVASGVVVTHRTQPRDDEVSASRLIFVGSINGEVEIPAFTGARLPRNDVMRVEWVCRVGGLGQDEETIELALADLIDAFDDTAADDHNLSDDDSVMWHQVTGLNDVTFSDGGGSGLIGSAVVPVEYHLRLV